MDTQKLTTVILTSRRPVMASTLVHRILELSGLQESYITGALSGRIDTPLGSDEEVPTILLHDERVEAALQRQPGRFDGTVLSAGRVYFHITYNGSNKNNFMNGEGTEFVITSDLYTPEMNTRLKEEFGLESLF